MRVEIQLAMFCRSRGGHCFFLIVVFVWLEVVPPLLVRIVGGKILLSGAWDRVAQNVCQFRSLPRLIFLYE